ncbi:DNA (cytosine-5-)-methyltransferase [Stylosanthes scabra]|uniref:DNA (cytosine-5-)-methyltransferase n=1 Tax=Stylosanthes scabra TaxID=79078 RepID=A0ABU6UVK8_9FABA|nr:DNA (cytosine-5-)-methyltransferase [Stylosanthes scabra]
MVRSLFNDDTVVGSASNTSVNPSSAPTATQHSAPMPQIQTETAAEPPKEGGDESGGDSDSFDWNSEDEREIENFQSSSLCLIVPNGAVITGSVEASPSAGPSNSKVFDHFVSMGFPREMVCKVIEEYGEENEDKLLEELLSYSVLESSPQPQQQIEPNSRSSGLESSPQPQVKIEPDLSSSEGGVSSWENSDSDSLYDEEEITKSFHGNDNIVLTLVKMGYKQNEALVAIERLGCNSSVDELIDFIEVAQMVKAEDALLPPEEKKPDISKLNKRRYYEVEVLGRKKPKSCEKRIISEDDGEPLHLPKPMIGFGVPTESVFIKHRKIPEDAVGPPYFYYENVALAPKGVWQTISRFLYEVEPEFVDSKYFCAAARKRGYIHNLPIENRFPLLPLPPRTIHEAFPLTRKWWPSWDTRTKLNCLQTAIGSAKLTERIRKALENYDGEPPKDVQSYVLEQCRKWNLVWVGRNKVAPLEPDEVETLLGFPRNHTRGGGISRTDRYKSLGNSFQVDTVAYHLSVLKDMYPNGMNILSLFSGIGGAEVALHRLGVPLKNVVSVEKSEVNRNIVRSWWEQTNQKGNLIDLDDVQQLNADRLEQLMNTFGGFDLIVGGSPCNNLAGSNRVSRDGLEGKESSLFFDYFRILDLVKNMMTKYQ